MFCKIVTLLGIYFSLGAVAVAYISRSDKNRKRQWTKYLVYLLIVFANVIIIEFFPGFYPALVTLILLAGTAELIKNRTVDKRIFTGSLSLYLFLSALTLCFVFHSSRNVQLWLYMLVLTFDGFSQITGQIFGRIRITPRISPSKTLEGLTGGTLVTVLTAYFLKSHFPEAVSQTTYLIMVLKIAFFSFAGDILASAYKRKAGIKDYSNVLPGHGGILDRFDSFIAATAGYGLYNLIPG